MHMSSHVEPFLLREDLTPLYRLMWAELAGALIPEACFLLALRL
jgi:hypothetical protein